MTKQHQVIAVGSGWGAVNMGTSRGPLHLLNRESYPSHLPPDFFTYITAKALADNYHKGESFKDNFATTGAAGVYRLNEAIKTLNQHYTHVKTVLEKHQKPIILGGDHSIAIATWSAAAVHQSDALGLIWIDAHLDAHTFETSPSQAVFGMPVAALLGFGDERLTSIGSPSPKISASNMAYIGSRDFEAGEKDLVDRLGIKIFSSQDVDRYGFDAILNQARQWVTRNTKTFGISIDIDAFDPNDAPGTGVCVPNGLRATNVLSSLAHLAHDDQVCAIEIVEFNPMLDRANKTAHLIWELLFSLWGGIYEYESHNEQINKDIYA